MALNGDAVTADANRKMNRAASKMLNIMVTAMEKGAGAAASKLQKGEAEREKHKLLDSYGITKEFQKYMDKGGKMKSVFVHKSDYLDFAEQMKNQNTPFITATVVGDDSYCIRYRDCDSEKVEEAIKMLIEARKLETEMSPERFTEKYAGKGVYSIEGIDMVELELIRHYAAQKNFQFAAVAVEDGSVCKILFNDKAKMDDILKNMGWQLTGEQGPKVREEIEYRIAGRENSRAILTREDLEQEYFIVSKDQPGNYLHLTADAVEMYKDNKVVSTLQRSVPDCYERSLKAVAELKNPVAVNQKEWESAQRDAIIANRKEIIPSGPSAAERVVEETNAKEQQARDVYDLKLSLDNSYSLQHENPMTDPTISYTQFFQTECQNDRYEEGIAHAAAAAEYLNNKKIEVHEKYSERTENQRDEEISRSLKEQQETIRYGTDSREL